MVKGSEKDGIQKKVKKLGLIYLEERRLGGNW
jgi:hypothetical protein